MKGGFIFVRFYKKKEAKEVMKASNGHSAQGHKLEINLIKFACMDKKLMKDSHWRTKTACNNAEHPYDKQVMIKIPHGLMF